MKLVSISGDGVLAVSRFIEAAGVKENFMLYKETVGDSKLVDGVRSMAAASDRVSTFSFRFFSNWRDLL